MQEQLITFKTAKLAKEKGFKIQCQNGWRQPNDSFEHSLYDKENEPFNLIMDSRKNSHYIERPTQSLLQKWLREKYKIHIAVYPIKHFWMMDVRDCVKTKKCHVSKYVIEKEFDSYEEALEEGLQEALKLININL